MNDASHIYQKKKALSKFFCDELINYFESNPSKQVSGNIALDGEIVISRVHKNSIEMDLDMHLRSKFIRISKIISLHKTSSTLFNF